VVLLVLSSNLPLHSAFIFGVDWTQTTKNLRADEPDIYSALKAGPTKARQVVTWRSGMTAPLSHALYKMLGTLDGFPSIRHATLWHH
jgi:hypothetical protein